MVLRVLLSAVTQNHHLDGSIADSAAWAAYGRNERTQREFAAFDINFDGMFV
jgi:hypothetical protein